MSKGTVTELAPAAGNVEVDHFNIDPHIIALMIHEPFYAGVLRGVTKICTKQIPTAGVLAKDGDLKMWYNPSFMAGLTSLQVRGLLKHEALHLALMHTTTRRLTPHKVHNWAADLAINSTIPEVELPEGGLIPGKAFAPLTPEQQAKMQPEQIARYQRMSDFIAALPKGLSTEDYFARLMEDEQMKQDMESQEQDKGQGGGDAPGEGGKGGEPGDGESGGAGGSGSGGPPMPGEMDSHDGWDSLSDEEKELAAAKVRQAVGEAAKRCDQKGSWGSVPSAMQGEIRQLLTSEIPWQAVLKKFVGFTKRSVRSTSWNRVNKKNPMLMPGARKKNTASIAVYIDQSGSVSDHELELLFGELGGLSRHTEFTCFHFDTEVDEDSETVWKKGRVKQPHRTRCGGTDFKVVQDHAMKNKHRFDGYLVLTDGYAPDPGHSRMKRGWVITTDGAVQEWMETGKDFVIAMKEPNKQAA